MNLSGSDLSDLSQSQARLLRQHVSNKAIPPRSEDRFALNIQFLSLCLAGWRNRGCGDAVASLYCGLKIIRARAEMLQFKASNFQSASRSPATLVSTARQ